MMHSLITNDSITVAVKGRPHTVHSQEPTFEALKQALKDGDWDAVPRLLSTAAAIEDFSSGEVEVKDGEVLFRGHVCHGTVVDKILELMKEGFDISPLTNFLSRVENNPSIDARRELYDFCEANNFMIDEQGFLIAYKAVRDDYKDIHSGRMDNSVGATPSMKREAVNADRRVQCSAGLHFAAYDYAANSFGGARTDRRLMIVRVDPADVVAVPTDYGFQKGRAWRYQVIGEIGEDKKPLERKTFGVDDFEVDLDDEFDVLGIDFDEDFDEGEEDVEGEVVFDDGMDEDEIRGALSRAVWVVSGPDGAARRLSIPESTLRGRMKRLGIVRP